ncbi:Sortilin, neurotensin receptor 3 [Neorhodopirellula lusitana]|uniref:Sortilin, neurotensin receptor 3 n=2 Tax=Neorhodopirellula lusitana TaxID=445327 RepID=A0ABY1QRT9_9BACT|nr:Sortilin, neurotensin receptor 3 [Neorhodopirellula lusitana]
MLRVSTFLAVSVLLFNHSVFSQEPPADGVTRLEAWKQHQWMSKTSRFKQLPWQTLGPKFAGGRIEAVDTPRGDLKTIYAAVGSGGVWKTANAGLTWKPLFTNESTFAIGDITVAPSDANTVWVGTGECHLGGNSFDGTGVFKSDDAGESWTNMGLPDSKRISKIVIDPSDKNIVYVGVMGGRVGGESSGVYKTTDGGKNFTRVLSKAPAGIIDLVMDPNDSERLFAASWSRRGDGISGIYRSDDAGQNWTRLKGGLLEEKVGRIALDVSTSNPGTVYALMVDHSQPGSRNRDPGSLLFRSDDSGDTWECTHEGVVPTYVGWDFCDLRVAADNADEVYIGGLRLVRSRDGGKTFIGEGGFKHNTNDGNLFRLHSHRGVGLHLDVHEVWTDPENPDRVMLGNDGGLLVSWDRGETWLHLNNLPIAEFYCVHLDDEKPFRIWGGTQDNASFVGPSTARFEPGKEDEWEQVFLDPWSGGDGFETFPDPNDSTAFFFSQQNGSLQRGRLGDLQSGRRIRPKADRGTPHQFAWWTPFFASQHTEKTVLYCASQFVMRSEDRGDSWTKISPNLDRGALRKLSESPIDPKRLVAGGQRRVYFTSDGGETWEQRSNGLPQGNISDVITSHHDPDCVYVAMSSSSDDNPASIVYVTYDFGKTWKSIASNLPHEPVYSIAEDPKTAGLLFAGTELGVYVTLDSGITWESLCATLPPAPVFDLAVHGRDGALVAATHGLSIFLLEIDEIRRAAESQESTPIE